jgi:hypothetical protein
MKEKALSIIGPVANAELLAMNQSLTQVTASEALYGLLGYVRADHNRNFQLAGGLRQSLIDAEVDGAQYSASTIAIALQNAGVQQATSQQVMQASEQERTELTALGAAGGSISPFEAFVIAADGTSDGGFQCNQSTLNAFLSNLLGK